MSRIYNFSAGPAVLPESVLEIARDNLLDLHQTGIGVCEHSHRGKAFVDVYEQAIARCREIANISEDYDVLFLQGGASSQFYMVPMNFLAAEQTADYLVTGSWSQKAVLEARLFGNVHESCSSVDTGFDHIPAARTLPSRAVYTHFTSNNTIFGTQFSTEPECADNSFLVCDASSDIFSRPIDVHKYGIIYAGAQKNLGPSGVTLVIIRRDLIQRGKSDLPTMLRYQTHSSKQSMFNTPPTFGIFLMSEVFRWILDQGGLNAVSTNNENKAAPLYDFLDRSELFRPAARDGSRSLMNVTFVTGNAELDAKFVSAALEAGMSGLKGHRSVGGMRASIYNAFPAEGVQELVRFMSDFEAQHA